MTAPLLAVRNLSKRFAGAGRNVVDGVSLDLAAGEILALVGPSGCGKSTTLRMIAGFEMPDAGSISVAGRDIGALAPEKRGIGMVFQDYALFPHMTVGANVLFGARQRDGDEAARFLDMVGLAGFEARYPDELSGGQQQRVALARSFAARPSLLLLDEPFSNLDAALRSATRREIRRLLKDAGLGILFVTHDQEEAMSFADRIAVMRDGQVLQTGRAQEVYDQPANMFVAGFLGRSNFIDGVADGAYCDTSIGRLPLAAPRNGAVRLALRPENIAIAPAEGQPGNGRVVGVEFKGHDTTYWVASGGLELQVDVMQGRRLAEGAEVRLSVNGAVVALD